MLIPRTTKVLLFISMLFYTPLWGYVPKSIEGKYKFGAIDSDFYYSYWLQTTIRDCYGSDALVRESYAPSAMVDKDGVLFAVTLYGFSSSDGPNFRISKYTPNSNGSILYNSIYLYPWLSKYTGVTPGTSSEPYLKNYDDEKYYFRDCIYNVFSPCLAQEPGDVDTYYICLFFYIPPTRFMKKGNRDTEGLMYFDFNKSSLSFSERCFYKNSDNAIYRFDRQRPCRDGTSYKLYPQISSYSSWHMNSNVHVTWIGLTDYWAKQSPNFKATFYSQYNKDWGENNSEISQIDGIVSNCPGGMMVNKRFILIDNYVYGMVILDGYTPVLTMQTEGGNTVVCKAYNWSFLYVESLSRGDSCHTAYNYDFCILKAKDGTKIWCVLGFNASGSYSSLDGTYGWSSTYCNWNTSLLSLTFRSFALDSTSSTGSNYVQNVIYTTNIKRASNIAVSSGDTVKSDLYRLYLNTHKICVWTSPKTGCQYIIYAYCYPGLKKQLYLGYAPIEIDSNYKVHLITKMEFKDSSENSFGDFTSCSRIVSMDCRNDHLWITFMSEDSDYYRYFHIKASDLIQE